ncbi:MAG: phage/plasmid primase, P4 family [Candidatus Omnitrophica bacterium]|nr:phage/plasmid primase, P4 family [Candidatus Omnitrophota bacterium]
MNTLLLESLSILFEPGDVVELRALGKRRNEVQSGYFKDFAKLSEVARMLDITNEQKGIYLILNQINPALYARSPDKLTPARAQPTTTADQDIIKRRWLPVDFDPIRPSDISSTDEEHQAAIDRAKAAREALKEMGFPDPILADSGNGAHLLYKIDLPNDQDSKHLIETVLKSFDALFSDDRVEVDLKVFNAARIWKMYGTAAKKGDNIQERPWRKSSLLDIPNKIETVDRKFLELHAWAWEQKNQSERFQEASPKKGLTREIELGQWLAAHGLDIAKEKRANGGGTMYILDACPWDSSHRDHSAWAVQFASGAIAAGCHHNGCSGRGWRDLLRLYEPHIEPKRSERKEKIDAPIAQLTITDVADVEYDEDGKIEKVTFSPDKAADAISQYLRIISTPDERIWVYSEGIYKPNGETLIDQVLDQVAGDKYSIRAAKEVHRKIVLRTLEEFSVFDTNPYLFAVDNGVIDTKTGNFLEHSPEYCLTLKSPITYDPSAHCPIIAGFLKDSLGSEDNILSALDILTAKTTTLNFEYFAAAIGGGSNGKSILEELIRKFFGDDQVAEVEIATLTQNKFDKIQLYGKRFLINSEVSGDVKESRTIKAISGGMRIDADQKNKNHVQFRPHCFIFIDTNNPPRFSDNTHGFARRLVKIDFPYKFVDEPVLPNEKQRDPELLNKMAQPGELSGLLNLLIANACRVLPQKKIHQRGSGQELAEEYDLQSNTIAAFYDKFIEEAGLASWISSTATYECYKDFCKKINASPVRDRDFFAYAKKHFRAIKGRETTPTGKIRVFYGLDFDDEKYKSFINRTIIGPSLDQQEQQQDQQDQQDHQKRILCLIEENILYKENKVVSAGLAGPVGPDNDFDGPEEVQNWTSMNGEQVDGILKRCLAIIERMKKEVTPFILSIHAEGLEANISPNQCESWMRAHDWVQEGGKWRVA